MRIGARRDGKMAVPEAEEEALAGPSGDDGTTKQQQNQQHQQPMGSDATLLRTLLRSKPNTRLFRALFQYLPLRDSPNDNPNVELALQAGDLVLVRGPMDEDRFYWGETLDGRSGLVPSNFVVPDDQLKAMLRLDDNDGEQHQQQLLQNNAGATADGGWRAFAAGGSMMKPAAAGSIGDGCSAIASTSAECCPVDHNHLQQQSPRRRRPSSPSFTLNVPNHLAQISHDFTVPPDHHHHHQQPQQQQLNLPDSVCPYPPVDISRVSVQELRPQDQPRVPFPRELQVEKRLSRSVLLSWLPPDCPSTSQSVPFSQYQVCANCTIKAVVPGTFKCRALVEDLELDTFVNVSVRAVGADGNASMDAACTLAIGAEAPVAPQHVRVSQVTPVSALISWYPSNSNAEHVILLNALKVGVCPPAVFQVMLKGLSPSTIYRLSVRTKHPRAVLEKRPVERCVDFKTMAKIGLPDPPSNVQVEPGPQPNTLLVTWRPVTSQPRPPSRASVHAYLIYADGRNIAQVPGSTADHVLLRLADLADDPPVFLTVRTRTREGAISADSNVVRVPRGDDKQPTERRQAAAADEQQHLLTCSLPSHIFGDLVTCSTAPPLSAMAPVSADYVHHHHHRYGDPCCSSSSPSSAYPLGGGICHHRVPTTGGTLLPSTAPNAVSVAAHSLQMHGDAAGQRQQQHGGGLLQPMCVQCVQQPHKYATSQQQQRQMFAQATNGGTFGDENAAQYFTFHPKALHKEFARVEEPPSMLEMEQHYLLRHHQRQRLRSGGGGVGTAERRSFPLFQQQQPKQQRMPAGVLPGAQTMPVQKRPVPAQMFRLWDEEFQQGGSGGTRSEPDLRPSRMPMAPGHEDGGTGSSHRWFVAVDDHQQQHTAGPDELCFRKHQLIKVHGDVDRNGFYWGDVRDRFGLVPASKVIEIAKDDLFLAADQRQQHQQSLTSRSAEAPVTRRMRWGSFKSRSYEHATANITRYPSTVFSYSDEQQQQQQEVPSAATFVRRSRGAVAGGATTAEQQQQQHLRTSAGGVALLRNSSYEPHEQRAMAEREKDRRRMSAAEMGADGTGRNGGGRRSPHQQQHHHQLLRRDGQHQQQQQYQSPPAMPMMMVNNNNNSNELLQHQLQRQQHHQEEEETEEDGMTTLMPPPHQQQQRRTMAASMAYEQQRRNGVADEQQQQQRDMEEQMLMEADEREQYYHQQQQSSNRDRPPPLQPLRGMPSQLMVAKYDYSRQFSPNVDADQVELSFRQGDLITVYGPMDEDGFYLGELNGVRGLVPSNFLLPAAQPSATKAAAASTSLATLRPKGVVFSTDLTMANHTGPPLPVAPRKGVQQQQQMAGGGMPRQHVVGTKTTTVPPGMTSKMYKVSGTAPPGQQPPGKTLAKKSSDLSSRKTSQSATAMRGLVGPGGGGGGGTKKKG